jgi:hypothetical protein
MYPCSKVRFSKRVGGNGCCKTRVFGNSRTASPPPADALFIAGRERLGSARQLSHGPPRRAMVVAAFREENAWVESAQSRQYEGKYGAEGEARERETVKHRADAP